MNCSVFPVALAAFAWIAIQPRAGYGEEVEYDRDIRPILAANCLACHGQDEETRAADLRLDTWTGATADLGGYAAITPNDADASELIRRIESDDVDSIMPPSDSGHRLTADQKRLLREWISQGATYSVHWAWLPPQRADIPASENPIDFLIDHALAERGLSPNDRADPYQLIRRVTLDLTGLPPTVEQVNAFVSDPSSEAYEELVKGLLASEAFGEHWARMWLDLARYADTKGYEKDNPREIWRYRDWVIEALNHDLPYDQFTIEQLAGDLLPDPSTDQRLATAFHRNTLTNEEGGTDDEEFRVAAVKDRVDTTMQVWMGLTMGCAKCHSHKYDPISQRDYYRFYAYFNQTADNDRETPLIETPTAEQAARREDLQSLVRTLRKKINQPGDAFEAAFRDWSQDPVNAEPWKPLDMLEANSAAGVAWKQQPDHQIIADGKLPETDTTEFLFRLPDPAKITALRIEVLPKLKEGNPRDKNFVLSELKVALVDEQGAEDAVTLAAPRADFSQANWPVANAIDGKADTGWAVSPQANAPHVAIFSVANPPESAGKSKLLVKVEQNYGQQLVLSRIRISSTSDHAADLSAVVQVDPRERFRKVYPATKKTLQELEQAEKSLAEIRQSISKTPVMQELPTDKQRQTRIHRRGNFLDPDERVQPGVPAAFHDFPASAPANRLGVAKWITAPDNPLTARVMVNRVWARLFGLGIVETEEDFGTQGMRPTHPQLLDHLAVEFQQSGWSLKELLKSVVTSSVYQRSSEITDETLRKDPRNQWLSRGPRFRMSAEMIRDQALAASGLLTHKIGGPSVMPPQPDGIWKSTYSNRKWINAEGEDRYRRGIYTYWKRTSPYPSMTTFDAGSGEFCLVRRVRTNTPLQALITLNDPAFVEAAGALSRKLQNEGVELGFRRLLTRPPTEREKERLQQLHHQVKQDYQSDQEAARQLVASAGLETDSAEDGADTMADSAAWIAVANVLLNLDETVTKP